MKQTDQSLLEQMRITDLAIASRKELFKLTPTDEAHLKMAKPHIEGSIHELVDRFYEAQTTIPEVGLVIGDSDTLGRLKSAQRAYIADLFSGYYDLEYVNNRLRIGLVHKRIGVEPKLYLAAIETLKELLLDLIETKFPDVREKSRVVIALRRLLMFDVSLVFDTYIRSMISEIEISKQKSDFYATVLEAKVKERTLQLETLSRTDPLTGLLNMRYLDETLTRTLRSAQRRKEPVSLAYIDVNDFKIINDTHGHQRGDEILQLVANSLKDASRQEDSCFRYGGDEFCVVMADCTQEGANEWKNRLLLTMRKHEGAPSLSIGIVQTGPEKYVSSEELVRQADQEMYAVKVKMKST